MNLAGAEAGGGVVATHEGEAGVRRAAREEEELPDPLGLHRMDQPEQVGVGVALVLGLHRRWPPVGGWRGNWEVVPVGIRGGDERWCVWGVFIMGSNGWLRNRFVGTDGGWILNC